MSGIYNKRFCGGGVYPRYTDVSPYSLYRQTKLRDLLGDVADLEQMDANKRASMKNVQDETNVLNNVNEKYPLVQANKGQEPKPTKRKYEMKI